MASFDAEFDLHFEATSRPKAAPASAPASPEHDRNHGPDGFRRKEWKTCQEQMHPLRWGNSIRSLKSWASEPWLPSRWGS